MAKDRNMCLGKHVETKVSPQKDANKGRGLAGEWKSGKEGKDEV